MRDLTKKHQLGTTDVKVLPHGLGTAHISKSGEKVAVETVEEAITQGIQFIDTAPLYGRGMAETYVGMALRGVPRDSYALASKVGRVIQPDGEIIFDFSRDGIMRSIEASLDRLGLDRVEVLHIHDPDNHFRQALDEAYPALDDLRRQGVIKAIGSGMNQWEMLEEFGKSNEFNCFLLAGRYTLLEQTSLDFLAFCQEQKIGVILGGVYNSGILVRTRAEEMTYNYSAAPAHVLDKAHKLDVVCKRLGVALNVAALHFCLAHPAVTTLVIGAETPDEVRANLDALHTNVPVELWEELRQQGLIPREAPVPEDD